MNGDGPRLTHPDWYPQRLELVAEAILFVSVTRQTYLESSFLDGRMNGPDMRGAWIPLADVRAGLQGFRARPDGFIFHIGHCGSTLVSRLLDTVPGVLGLREPLPLRTLAEARLALGQPWSLLDEAGFDELLGLCLSLWGRTYAPDDRVVVKATSMTNDLIAPMLTAVPDARAVALYLKLEPYLATLLGGDSARIDLRAFAAARMQRFVRDRGAPPKPLAEFRLGELAAFAWLVEICAIATAADGGDRLLAVDFEGLLAAPGGQLGRIACQLGFERSEQKGVNMAGSPLWTRHSKSPGQAYDPGARDAAMDRTRATQAGEIAAGLAFADALLERETALAGLVAPYR